MFRKLKPDSIFNGNTMLPPEKVLVFDAGGRIEAILDAEDAGDNIETIKGILSPGFINSHCHVELSYLKGKIARGTGLVDFVLSVIAGRSASGEQKLISMKEAEAQMYQKGIIAIGDICNTPDSIAIKQDSALYWQNFIEVTGFIDSNATERFQLGVQIQEAFKTLLPWQHISIVPHAAYSVSKSLFQQINAVTGGQLVSIHNQESQAEEELFISRSGDLLRLYVELGIDISSFESTGKSSLQTWLPYFVNGQKIISVHNSFSAVADLEFARQYKYGNLVEDIYFCLCPHANLYIENRLPPVERLIENGCNIILGTDSLASNSQLDIMAEVRLLRTHFPSISLETMLQWATSKGAEALGIEDSFGSIAQGKQPGIVHISEELEAHKIA